MGTPFLILSLADSVAVFAVVLVIVVVGEMLWVPTSSAALVKLAPEERRGAYLGVFNAGVPVALAVVPLVGFPLADAAGDTAMWALVAAVGGVAALSFVALANVFRARGERSFEVAPIVE
jgi:MFS family permease